MVLTTEQRDAAIEPFLTLENATVWKSSADQIVWVINHVLHVAEVAITDSNIKFVCRKFERILNDEFLKNKGICDPLREFITNSPAPVFDPTPPKWPEKNSSIKSAK